MDYAYNVQGWMKGLNQTSLNSLEDPDSDGNDVPFPKDALSFSLHYFDETVNGNKNQLQHVQDLAPAGNYTVAGNNTADIDDQSNPSNYTYDLIGNMTSDDKEGVTNITWSVYGKILSLYKNGNPISYTYDASGNRISKTVGAKTTIYVRDASGNVMSLYESELNAMPLQKELHIYGSSRLGILATEETTGAYLITSDGFGDGHYLAFKRGLKSYELTNHLGNVLETVSDRKIAIDANSDGEIELYEADVVTANDYYPYGMQMPGRRFEQTNAYRYSINGQEKSNEINENLTSALYWEYDSRIGRRWNVDPVPKIWESGYLCFNANPILINDSKGDDGDPPFYLRGKSGDHLADRIPRGQIENIIESFSPISVPDQLNIAQAYNFAAAVGGDLGYTDYKGIDHWGIGSSGMLGSKAFVIVPKASALYKETARVLMEQYKIQDPKVLEALMDDGLGGMRLTFEDGQDYSFLFWKSMLPTGPILLGGPQAVAIPIPIATPVAILPPGSVASTNLKVPIIINTKTIATELAAGYAQKVRVIQNFEDALAFVVNFAAEHTKNARPSTKDKHTARRAGKKYDKSQNAKRGAKNKKFQPRDNVNKRK